MNEELKEILKKQHYAIVGNHSGVKLCHWMRQSLLFGRECYKQTFYGIESHRCLQMTPTINQCTQNCLFCWRYQGFTELEIENPDDPEFILEESIKAQRKLITGFKGDERCDQRKWREANDPKHVACSLTGEPTLYPRLGEFFETCHKRGMTTFLVTNGTNPEALEKLDPLPTQLYISVVAPNKDIYKKLTRPLIPDGWERLQRTLELLPSLDTRTVIRHTLVNGWNMDEAYIDEYAKLDEKASPMFIEPKGFVLVGQSRQRMTLNNMPSHEQVMSFGKKLADKLGYFFANEKEDSRVVLLSKNKKVERINKQS
ncbi:MAG: 4-demethylwyosine synthase TYW1 [Thermoplasmata archaeon]|nr:MAG: 4-demethylwyosine synthase TYW1 [Thermoplasmata archaeon]MCD6468116.1 4-demethylwyosine synthase TYW1 [Thermoplasmata archaeon]